MARVYGNNTVTSGGNGHYYIFSGEDVGTIYKKLK